MYEDATWYGSRPRPRPHCIRRGPSSREKSTAAPLFSAHVYCGHGRPFQLLLSSCYISRESYTTRKYIGHKRLCVCLSVCLSVPRRIPVLLINGPGCNLGNGRGCRLVVHHWADLQSVRGFRCCDNIARTRNVNQCLYSLYAWFNVLKLLYDQR